MHRAAHGAFYAPMAVSMELATGRRPIRGRSDLNSSSLAGRRTWRAAGSSQPRTIVLRTVLARLHADRGSIAPPHATQRPGPCHGRILSSCRASEAAARPARSPSQRSFTHRSKTWPWRAATIPSALGRSAVRALSHDRARPQPPPGCLFGVLPVIGPWRSIASAWAAPGQPPAAACVIKKGGSTDELLAVSKASSLARRQPPRHALAGSLTCRSELRPPQDRSAADTHGRGNAGAASGTGSRSPSWQPRAATSASAGSAVRARTAAERRRRVRPLRRVIAPQPARRTNPQRPRLIVADAVSARADRPDKSSVSEKVRPSLPAAWPPPRRAASTAPTGASTAAFASSGLFPIGMALATSSSPALSKASALPSDACDSDPLQRRMAVATAPPSAAACGASAEIPSPLSSITASPSATPPARADRSGRRAPGPRGGLRLAVTPRSSPRRPRSVGDVELLCLVHRLVTRPRCGSSYFGTIGQHRLRRAGGFGRRARSHGRTVPVISGSACDEGDGRRRSAHLEIE